MSCLVSYAQDNDENFFAEKYASESEHKIKFMTLVETKGFFKLLSCCLHKQWF